MRHRGARHQAGQQFARQTHNVTAEILPLLDRAHARAPCDNTSKHIYNPKIREKDFLRPPQTIFQPQQWSKSYTAECLTRAYHNQKRIYLPILSKKTRGVGLRRCARGFA
jgi:hypothetical protein